jgi:hypothetical protein
MKVEVCCCCGTELKKDKIDGRIHRLGAVIWATVCPLCWKLYSASKGKYGIGLGQRFRLTNSNVWEKVAG